MKTIPSNPNYRIDKKGNVYNIKTKKKLTTSLVKGCPYVYLLNPRFRIIDLLAETYIKNPYKKGFVRQLDDDYSNLDLSRIEWEPITNKPYCDSNGETWIALWCNSDYQISDMGRVRRLRYSDRIKQGTILKEGRTKDGYSSVSILVNGKSKMMSISRAMLVSFTGENPPHLNAAHNDGNRRNNKLSNLRWATPKENSDDKYLHGTILYGENHPNNVLLDTDIKKIRKLYKKGKYNQRELSEIFGTCTSNISKIIQNPDWRA